MIFFWNDDSYDHLGQQIELLNKLEKLVHCHLCLTFSYSFSFNFFTVLRTVDGVIHYSPIDHHSVTHRKISPNVIYK